MKLLKFSLMALLISSLFIACKDDDEDPAPQPMSIAEIVADDANFSTLLGALQRTGLDATLSGTGAFTVFAPTNAAFDALGVDLGALSDAELTNILLYHVLGAEVLSSGIAEGDTYVTTASTAAPGGNQLSLYINNTAGDITLNGGAAVTSADVDATNGVVHVIDQVLLPPTVVDLAAANPLFGELVGALGVADGDLVTTLSGAGPFTVFAPVNSAFEAISAVVAGLTPEQLRDVLLYHVVSGNVRSTDLSDAMMVNPLLAGTSFTVNIDGSVTITDGAGNTVNVVLTDVQGTNGVIHVLDAVLLPM
ncbi:MAG: fasciclin domain-containing protein [Saprospiraceae bacterium]|jgi:transforming growth factor-beta-induced protein